MPSGDELIARIKDETIQKVIEAVSPFIDVPESGGPMPLKITNKTPQSLALNISIEHGQLILEFIPRRRTYEDDTIVVPPNEDRTLNLSERR